MEPEDLFRDVNPYEPPRSVDEPFRSQARHTEGIDLSTENPFLTIWTRPRATIRGIVDTDAGRHFIPLAVASGVVQTLDRAVGGNAGDALALSFLLVLAVVLGPISGLISVYLLAWFLGMTGRWFGRRAAPEHLSAAVAWSNVPILAALPVLAIGLWFFGGDWFKAATRMPETNLALGVVLLVCGAVRLILAVWWFVVLLKCVGEVQRFSAWAALGSLILAGLIAVAVVAAIAVIVVLLVTAFSGP
jgi:hypothetical protein